jgi:hypothetical protein
MTSSGHKYAFREARRRAFCKGILAESAASASSSAISEFRSVGAFVRRFWLAIAIIEHSIAAFHADRA